MALCPLTWTPPRIQRGQLWVRSAESWRPFFLFPHPVIYVGFDEIDLSGLNTSAILAWMPSQNLTTSLNVETRFLARIRELAAKNGRKLAIWDDSVGEGVGVPFDVALQVLNAETDVVQQLLQGGATASSSLFSSPFYLDNLDNTWAVMYAIGDFDMPGGAAPPSRWRRGESCMWGEQVR